MGNWLESLSTFWLSVLLFILILASAFFSASETSMMAINRYRLKSLSAKNNHQAKRVEKLLKNIDLSLMDIVTWWSKWSMFKVMQKL